jgi:hypothetical protein
VAGFAHRQGSGIGGSGLRDTEGIEDYEFELAGISWFRMPEDAGIRSLGAFKPRILNSQIKAVLFSVLQAGIEPHIHVN